MKHLTTQLVPSLDGHSQLLREPVLELKVTAGPAAKTVVRATLPRVLIGSSEGVQLRLKDRTVSALHCEIISDLEGLRVRDLGSKNGVFLKGRRVSEAWLEDEDSLTLGQSVVKVLATRAFEDRKISEEGRFFGLRGNSLAMRELFALLARVAASPAPVLIQGETGSGKELAAEALVAAGPRAEGPLVVVDCSALPYHLAEVELFGREAGAYTDARQQVQGAFERAHTGTLFLDEIGELPLELQPKLLGVLERKWVQRLGGTSPQPVDVRVIAATHRPLESMVNAGTFRADLYYRIAALGVQMPPLRSRREDIPELVQFFLSEIPGGTLSSADLDHLRLGDYPGNVRELRNAVLQRALGISPPAALEAKAAQPWDFEAPFRAQKEERVAQLEREYLVELMQRCKGNVSEAARRSGLNRVHLYQLFERHRLPARTGGSSGVQGS